MERRTDLTPAIVDEYIRSLPRSYIEKGIAYPGYRHPIHFPFKELVDVPYSHVYICRAPVAATKRAKFIFKILSGKEDKDDLDLPYLVPGQPSRDGFQMHNDISVHRMWHEHFANGEHCHARIPEPLACGNLNDSTRAGNFKKIGDAFYACYEYLEGKDLRPPDEEDEDEEEEYIPRPGTQWTFEQRRAFVRQMALHRIHCLNITSNTIGAPLDPRFFDNDTFHLTKTDTYYIDHPKNTECAAGPYEDVVDWYIYRLREVLERWTKYTRHDFNFAKCYPFNSEELWFKHINDLISRLKAGNLKLLTKKNPHSTMNKLFRLSHRDMRQGNNIMINGSKISAVIDWEYSRYVPYPEAVQDLYRERYEQELQQVNVDTTEWRNTPAAERPFGEEPFLLYPDLSVLVSRVIGGREKLAPQIAEDFDGYLTALEDYVERMKGLGDCDSNLNPYHVDGDYGTLDEDDYQRGDIFAKQGTEDNNSDDDEPASPGTYWDSDDETNAPFNNKYSLRPNNPTETVYLPKEWYIPPVWKLVDNYVMTYMDGRPLDKWRTQLDIALEGDGNELYTPQDPVVFKDEVEHGTSTAPPLPSPKGPFDAEPTDYAKDAFGWEDDMDSLLDISTSGDEGDKNGKTDPGDSNNTTKKTAGDTDAGEKTGDNSSRKGEDNDAKKNEESGGDNDDKKGKAEDDDDAKERVGGDYNTKTGAEGNDAGKRKAEDSDDEDTRKKPRT